MFEIQCKEYNIANFEAELFLPDDGWFKIHKFTIRQ